MKKSILFLLLIVAISVGAQKYHPFLTDNKLWGEIINSWDVTMTNYYKISEDTIINSIKYQKLYSCPDSLMRRWYLNNIFLREDTVQRKVYAFTSYNGEKLLYDFSVKVGDTIYNARLAGNKFSLPVVDSIKSIDYNGQLRKTFFFDEWYYESWIEGIGSTRKIFDPFSSNFIADLDFRLLFVKENNQTIYHNPIYTEDYYSSNGTGVNILKSDNKSIKINLVSTISNIIVELTENNTAAQYSILNIAGQCIKSGIASNKIIIDSSQFSTGIYIFRLYDKGHYQSQKFTITHL